MKKFIALVSLVLAAATTAIVACAKPPPAKLAAPQHRLGAQLNDAGMPVDDAGNVSIFLDAAVPAALGDPAIDHCIITSVSIDPPTGNFAAQVSCGPRNHLVQGTLTQAQLTAVYNVVRNAAAAGGIQ
ncbi:MAG TPA: hypothetical protein VMI75_22770 [Polyangiaceae bacterium]|nr:hypothetical protein [Polyangiaceae bacterium]